MIIRFGLIPLGVDHLTGPTGEQTTYKNTDVEHATARGKPQVQEIGAERDTKTFSFFFDDTFCNVSAEHAKLSAALASRSAAPLNVPGQPFRGVFWRVESLDVTTQATNKSGRIVRMEATITLKEAPVSAGGLSAIGAAFTNRIGVGLSVRVR